VIGASPPSLPYLVNNIKFSITAKKAKQIQAIIATLEDAKFTNKRYLPTLHKFENQFGSINTLDYWLQWKTLDTH
jgi:hypothetical protein